MDQLFLPRAAWVLSGSVMGWRDELVQRLDAAVFVTVEPSIRLARLGARERRRYGSRIDPGGDREAAFVEFLEWAAGYDEPGFGGRSLVAHEHWLGALACPVLRVDGARPPEELVSAVRRWEPPRSG